MHLMSQKKTPPFHVMPPHRTNWPEAELRTIDNENARLLWIAVMERAILDLQESATQPEAIEWILSKRRSIGSFYWVCHQLDMDPGSVKRALLGPRFLSPNSKSHAMIASLTIAREVTTATAMRSLSNESNT